MVEQFRKKEQDNFLTNRYEFQSFKPGGNNTSLILGEVSEAKARKRLNDIVMKNYADIEQVGFVSVDGNGVVNLMMAGGEFCGNATRSTAYLALAGKSGDLKIKVSGVNGLLDAGVTEEGEAYAQMPVYEDVNRLQNDKDNPNAWIVEMEGITHYVLMNSDEDGRSPEDIKRDGMALLKEKELTNYPASGVIYASQQSNGWQIKPVVYVRDIDTCFYESACGSGTTALGQVLALLQKESVKDLPIIQPSGQIIKISVDLNRDGFTNARICGPIDRLSEGTIIEKPGDLTYIIEKMSSQSAVERELRTNGLVELYEQVFARGPYFEQFIDAEVEMFWREYVAKGIALVAKSNGQNVGFASAVPVITDEEISRVASENNIDPRGAAYIAELGVAKNQEGKGIGKSLIEELLFLLPDSQTAVLRTTKFNRKARNLYQSLGFFVLPGTTQIVTSKRIDGEEWEDERILMVKNL